MGSFGSWVSALDTKSREILKAEAEHVPNGALTAWSRRYLSAYWCKFAGMLARSGDIEENNEAGLTSGMRAVKIGEIFEGEGLNDEELLAPYFEAMQSVTWSELRGVLGGKHSMLMPIHRKGDELVIKCYLIGRDADASDIVKATAPDMEGCEMLCLLELGRYAMPGTEKDTPIIGVNSVTVDARLGSTFISFEEEEKGHLVGEPVGTLESFLDTNEPGSMECMGLGPIEEAMYGYSALKVKHAELFPSHKEEKPTNTGGIDFGNRGGIDPSLN